MKFRVVSVLTGRAVRFADDGETSAIAKFPAPESRRVGWLGIEGDEQADILAHGGPDKAIHHYPRDHYDWWAAQLGANPLLNAAGAFGENISTSGLTENDVCIGDRFRLGTALVEICQGRQPCWKQAHRIGYKRIVAMMVKSGKSGWYYRVIEEGDVAAGDTLMMTDRLHPEWNVARVTALVVAGVGREGAADLARVAELAEGWRARARTFAD